MPKSKGWKRGAVKKGNQRASKGVSIEGKYDFIYVRLTMTSFVT